MQNHIWAMVCPLTTSWVQLLWLWTEVLINMAARVPPGVGQVGDISEHEPTNSGITILTAGRSGSGKSTLISNLLGKKPEMIMSPDSVTLECHSEKVVKNGVKITILDTTGLKPGWEEKRSQLRDLAHANEANIIIYFLPIGPSSKFDDGNNREIMKALQDTYGKTVWSRCVLALTFSDLARNHIQTQHDERDDSTVTREYMKHIKKYAAKFQEELNNLGNSDEVIVKTQLEDETNQESPHTIVAIPTEMKMKPQGNIMLFQEMIKKCPPDRRAVLLQYQYGRKVIIEILKKGGVLVGSACATGTAIGATAGSKAVVGGAIGCAVGGGVGLLAAGAVGAVMLTVKLDKKRKICEYFGVIDKIDTL